MKDSQTPLFVDVSQLRVGMFVHLDVGWMAHPFALGSFRIASADQIDTIRGLGVPRVRWDPARSDPGLLAPLSPAAAPAAPGVMPSAPGPAPDAGDPVRQRRRGWLREQQAVLAQCEREFGAATRAHRRALDLVQAQPAQARALCDEMVQGFMEHVGPGRETCLRLLHEAAGDRAGTHGLNVTVVSLLLGRALGLDAAGLETLALGALLHDVGKVELPARLRWREEHFTLAELQYYQEHVAQGVGLARRMQLDEAVVEVIAQHHEHMDGTGFPRRLAGEQLCVPGRIVALVNRYDGLCNPANAARALTPHEALSLMFAQMKARFDVQMLGAFIRMMGVYPPGSVVELTDGRHALVVSVNSSRPLKPRVIVHDAEVPAEEALVLDLEAEPGLGIRRSLRPQQLPRAALDYLSPRPRICYFFERARDLGALAHGRVA